MESKNSGLRRFRNTEKMMAHSLESWQIAEEHKLTNFYASTVGNSKYNRSDLNVDFTNMSSYSYLGLNRHPQVIQGGIEALSREKLTCMGITPTRIKPLLMQNVQEEISQLFNAQCLLSISCTVATMGFLPLISSGFLFDKKPRVMAFDRKSHFCMDMMKPICAEEAQVEICPHNDMNFLEDLCKKHDRVAYVADGAYSMGGAANVDAISMMQDKYGLVAWYDDSHALSVIGDKGQGYVKSKLGELNPLTLISASLEKGFGTAGGIVMMSKEQDQSFLNFATGPMCWSQTLSIPNLGFIQAGVRLHDSPELGRLQTKLQKNIDLFDSLIPTQFAGNSLPVRCVITGDRDEAIRLSIKLLEHEYYCSPVYYPVTSRGSEGLRVMIRADMEEASLRHFCELLKAEIPSLRAKKEAVL